MRKSKRRSRSIRRGNSLIGRIGIPKIAEYVSESYVVRTNIPIISNSLYQAKSMQKFQNALKELYTEEVEINNDEDYDFEYSGFPRAPLKNFNYIQLKKGVKDGFGDRSDVLGVDKDGQEFKVRLIYRVSYVIDHENLNSNLPEEKKYALTWSTTETPTFRDFYEYEEREQKKLQSQLDEDEDYTEEDFKRNGRDKEVGQKIMKTTIIESIGGIQEGKGRIMLRANEKYGQSRSSYYELNLKINSHQKIKTLRRKIYPVFTGYSLSRPRLWGHPPDVTRNVHVEYKHSEERPPTGMNYRSITLNEEQVRNINIDVTVERSSNKTVQKVKSISIEINENFVDQYDAIHKFMKQFNYVFKHKKHNDKLFDNESPFSKTYNYVFEKRAHDVLMDK